MNYKITIKRINMTRLSGIKVISLILVYSFLCPLLFQDNNIAKLVYDILLLALILLLFKNNKSGMLRNRTQNSAKLPLLVGVVYIGICFISALINNTPIVQFWWNARTSITCVVFWIGCIVFLNNQHINTTKDIFLKLNHINFVVVLIEFALGISQDYLGGIFGVFGGTNSLLNVFMLISTTIAIERLYVLRKNISPLFMVLVENCLVAALSELKIYFIEIVIISVAIVLLNRPSRRTIGVMVAGFVILYIGVQALYYYNPYYANFFTLEGLVDSYNNAYTDNDGLSRGSAFRFITTYFLTNPLQRWLGIGFGKATFSNISILASEFYDDYKYLKYNWFCHSYKLLETGYLGVVTFVAFWLSPFFNMQKQATGENRVISKTIAICTVLLFVYNTSLMNLYTMFVLIYFISLLQIEREEMNE